MVFAECNKLYEYGFWSANLQISDIENKLKNVDLNILCEGGSPLHLAVLFGNKAHVEFLISKGADVSIKEENEGNTPLHWAKSNTDPKLQAEIVMVLLMNGADANARNNNQDTLLHKVFPQGTVESVRNLILAGADPFAIGHLSKTPIDKLCEYNNPCGNLYFSEGSPTFEIFKPKE